MLRGIGDALDGAYARAYLIPPREDLSKSGATLSIRKRIIHRSGGHLSTSCHYRRPRLSLSSQFFFTCSRTHTHYTRLLCLTAGIVKAHSRTFLIWRTSYVGRMTLKRFTAGRYSRHSAFEPAGTPSWSRRGSSEV